MSGKLAAAKSMKVYANPNWALRSFVGAVKTFLLLIAIPNLCLVTAGEEPSIARRSDLAFIVRWRDGGADYCQSQLVTGIQNHIGMHDQQVRGGASGDRIHRLVGTRSSRNGASISISIRPDMCFPPPASILTGASAADHEEVRFVQTPFWISSIWADDDFRRIENQFEEGPVMLEDKLGPWSELGR